MKLIVHIGTAKTGSTSLQNFLHLNRARLLEFGYGYLKSPGLTNQRKLATYCFDELQVDEHSRDLGITGTQARTAWKKEFRRKFVGELESIDSGVHTVIISSEHFHSRLNNDASVFRLKELLDPYGDSIEIVVYLRRQDQLATSRYSTLIRSGLDLDNVLPQPSMDSQFYNYQVLLGRWSRCFGDAFVTARIFERERLHGGGLIDDFAHQIGMPDLKTTNLQVPIRKNEALSCYTSNTINKFNGLCRSIGLDPSNNRFIKDLRRRLIMAMQHARPGDQAMPARAEAIKFYEHFADSNEAISNRWLNNERAFSNDFSMYPEESTAVTIGKLELLHRLASTAAWKIVSKIGLKSPLDPR